MSVINQIPYLKTLLAGLSAEQLSTLNSCINGQDGEAIFRTLSISGGDSKLSELDKGVKPIMLELGGFQAQSIYKGYLVYTDTECAVISYANETSQLLTVIKIDVSDWSYEFLTYDCSIVELRSELNDMLVEKGEGISVSAGDISSGSATLGQVLTADGEGGASWQDASGGGEEEPVLVDLGTDPTLQSLLDYFEINGETKDCGYVTLRWANTGGNPNQTITGHLIIKWMGGLYNFGIESNDFEKNGSGDNLKISRVSEATGDYTQTLQAWVANYSYINFLCPPQPSDYYEKNYVLVAASDSNGPQWQEASSGGGSTPYIDLTAGTKTVDDVMTELGLTKTWGYYPNYINIVNVKKSYTGSTKENLMLLTFESGSHKLSIIEILNFNNSGDEKFETFYWEGLNTVIPSDLSNSPTVHVSKTLGGGTQLYKHVLSSSYSSGGGDIILITNFDSPISIEWYSYSYRIKVGDQTFTNWDTFLTAHVVAAYISITGTTYNIYSMSGSGTDDCKITYMAKGQVGEGGDAYFVIKPQDRAICGYQTFATDIATDVVTAL